MRISRRGFLGTAALLGGGCGPGAQQQPETVVPKRAMPSLDAGSPPSALETVLARAIDTAKKEGATYVDARIHQRRFETVSAREDHVVGVSSSETYGIGVRVIAQGAWGFASSSGITETDAMDAAKRAVAIAKVARQIFLPGSQNERTSAALSASGTSYAQDHRSVAFQRMPNVSLASFDGDGIVLEPTTWIDQGTIREACSSPGSPATACS